MQKYTITKDTAQSLLTYLAGRPYAEVAELITQLQSGKLEEIAPTPEMDKTVPTDKEK